MQIGTIENVGRLLQHGVLAGREIKCHDAGGMVGRTGAKHRAIAHSAHRAEFRERRGDRRERFVRQIQHRQAAEARLGIGADDPLGPGESIGRHAEQPLRQSKLRRHRRQRPHRSRREIEANKDSTSRSDRTRARSARRRATIPAGRSIPSLRRRLRVAR